MKSVRGSGNGSIHEIWSSLFMFVERNRCIGLCGPKGLPNCYAADLLVPKCWKWSGGCFAQRKEFLKFLRTSNNLQLKVQWFSTRVLMNHGMTSKLLASCHATVGSIRLGRVLMYYCLLYSARLTINHKHGSSILPTIIYVRIWSMEITHLRYDQATIVAQCTILNRYIMWMLLTMSLLKYVQ